MDGYKYWIVCAGLALALLTSGCAQLIGIKKYKSGDTEIWFNSGIDVGASINQVDTVENKRGIKPD